ncbi:MAG TPA: STAS domain-containing protein [Tepidisphaeraceae bacterium]|jgi:anti-sigma B factor antagonist|nr:STAS domain-containing protein [Tepidisphaeraceae bacterium]
MLTIAEIQSGAIRVFKPNGALCAPDVAPFRQRMLDAVDRHLGRFVIDMNGVPFIDSQGLEALVDTTQALSRLGQALRLSGATKTVREVMEVTGLADQFEHYDDTNAAVRSFLS